jgi:hypothetical protein
MPLFGGRRSVYVLVDGLATYKKKPATQTALKPSNSKTEKLFLLVFRCSQIRTNVQKRLRQKEKTMLKNHSKTIDPINFNKITINFTFLGG